MQILTSVGSYCKKIIVILFLAIETWQIKTEMFLWRNVEGVAFDLLIDSDQGSVGFQ